MNSAQSTAPMTIEVRRATAAHASATPPSEIAIGVIIGRTAEFFDFFVYAIAAVVVFPALCFPHLDALTGTLYSFAIFALAFIARPFGTVLFTAIDRVYGRGVKLAAALLLLGTATVAIAFVPGYTAIGNASVYVLGALRIGQGLALGGAWDGLATLLALSAPLARRGYYAMLPQLGAPLGLIVASLLFAYFIKQLSAADFLDWGWRYPFFVAFAINVVALFARLRIVVTPEYTQLFATRELQPTPIRETLRHGGRIIVSGAFAPLASFALFHMVTVFPLSWVFLYTTDGPADFLLIEALGAAFGIVAMLLSGWLADRIGRHALLSGSALAIAVFSGFAPQLLTGGTSGELAFMIIGFVLLGLAFAEASGAMAAYFALQYRYTGSALTADLAWLFGAGFAPWVALALTSRFGVGFSGAYLLSGALGTLIAMFVTRSPK